MEFFCKALFFFKVTITFLFIQKKKKKYGNLNKNNGILQ